MKNFQAELLIINANYSEGKSKSAFGSKTTAIMMFACKPQNYFWSTQLTSLSQSLSCPLIIKVILGTFPEIICFANMSCNFTRWLVSASGKIVTWFLGLKTQLKCCWNEAQTRRNTKQQRHQKNNKKKWFRTQGTKDGPKKVIFNRNGLTSLENK